MEQTLCIYKCFLRHKRKVNKEKSNLKSGTNIDPVTECFEIIQYNDKKIINYQKRKLRKYHGTNSV